MVNQPHICYFMFKSGRISAVMVDRSILILCISLSILLYIIFYLPLNDAGEKTEAKVSSNAAQELRLQETMKKFVKSVGDIEVRLQGLERKMDGVSKVKEPEDGDSLNKDSATGETKPRETKPRETKPGEIKPRETKPGEIKPGEIKQGEIKPGEIKQGEIKQGENCLDSAEHEMGGEIELQTCHKQGRNQFFEVKDSMIHHKRMCLSVAQPKSGAVVILGGCNQDHVQKEWRYHDKVFQAGESGFCMASNGFSAITLEQCNADEISQQWNIE